MSSIFFGIFVVFILIGWPITAVILMMKGSVEGYKARKPPAKESPKKNKNGWKFYLGLTMIVLWAIMIIVLGRMFS
jgi:hypothetical protein